MNRASATQLAALISGSGVKFRAENAQVFTVDSGGNNVLEGSGGIDNVPMGQVVGFEFPGEETGSKDLGTASRASVTPPGIVNRGTETLLPGAGSAGSPNQNQTHAHPELKQEAQRQQEEAKAFKK